MGIHFIKDPKTLEILNLVLELAGINFNIPFDASAQPTNGSDRNSDILLQMQLPGGAIFQGLANPLESKSMADSISSVMAGFSSFLSSYSLILPILGVIRGIIEIICALLNPFAVIRAVIRLFKKWIPPFLALFPPFAILLIIIAIIKIILSIIFFIITVVVPVVKLILHNIEILIAAFGVNGNKQQQDAGRTKLLQLILSLFNQLGIMEMIKPILEVIMIILETVSGFPCDKGDEDSTCCEENVCPAILNDPPKGKAIIIPSFFSDSLPGLAWTMVSLEFFASPFRELIPLTQGLASQLNPQLDEPIDEAQPAGSDEGTAYFNIRLTGVRGGMSIISPIVKIPSSNVIMVIDPDVRFVRGVVNYEIIPNWDVLIANGIVGLGCHPDIAAAKAELKEKMPGLPTSGLREFPTVAPLADDYNTLIDNVVNEINDISNQVEDIVGTDKLSEILNTSPKLPPYDDNINAISNSLDNITDLLFNSVDSFKSMLSDVVVGGANKYASEFFVDKHIVKVSNDASALVTVIPKDVSGTAILKDLPDGVSLPVKILTTFGKLGELSLNSSDGSVTTEISSQYPGAAVLTAKINNDFISDINDNIISVRTQDVKFVSDALLPKRRLVSKPKPSSAKKNITGSSDKEPG